MLRMKTTQSFGFKKLFKKPTAYEYLKKNCSIIWLFANQFLKNRTLPYP